MNYTLITRSGRIIMFYIKSAAEIYHRAYGGSLIDMREHHIEDVVSLQQA